MCYLGGYSTVYEGLVVAQVGITAVVGSMVEPFCHRSSSRPRTKLKQIEWLIGDCINHVITSGLEWSELHFVMGKFNSDHVTLRSWRLA